MSKLRNLFTAEEWPAVEAHAGAPAQQPLNLFTTEERGKRVREISCGEILDIAGQRRPPTSLTN